MVVVDDNFVEQLDRHINGKTARQRMSKRNVRLEFSFRRGFMHLDRNSCR